jgi:polyhydroxyalkanoate synthesis repressor PhaR
MPVIKRYPNRKLYDTAARQYIALDGVAALIRAGAEVQVVDHATGEDLTALILMQIIVEQEKRQSGFLPQALLAGLVQAGGHTLAALRRSLIAPLDLVRHVDEEIERRIRSLVLAGDLAEEDGLSLRDRLLALGGPRASGDGPEELALRRALARRHVPDRAQVQALADQLAALEAELAALAGAPSARRPPDQ